MKTRVQSSNEIVNKTISGIGYYYGRGIAIAFTDDTFCYFQAFSGYEGEVELDYNVIPDLGSECIVDAGIMTQKEFTERIEKRRYQNSIAQEAKEKREYERLKARFEKS